MPQSPANSPSAHPADSKNGGSGLSWSAFLALTLVWILVAFGAPLFGWRSFFSRDFLSFGYPYAWFLGDNLRQGEIPLWNSHLIAGIPHLAQWNTLVLYPPMVLASLAPAPWGLNLFQILHAVLGGAGMWKLVHHHKSREAAASESGSQPESGLGEAMAALAYIFGGLMLTALMWPNNIAALGWLPWVLHFAGQCGSQPGLRSLLKAAMATALQLLTGAPEIIAMTWLLGIGFALTAVTSTAGVRPPANTHFKNVLRLLCVFGLAGLLAAIQLVPFLELLQRSHRDTGYANDDWSMDWAGFSNLILPWFRTVSDRDGVRYQTSQQWLTSPYAGVWILIFALAALALDRRWRVRLAGLVALGFAWLSLGNAGGLFGVLKSIFPQVGVMRYPVKFLVPTLVILPWLAGLGLNAWVAAVRRSEADRALKFSVLVVATLTLVLGGIGYFQPMPEENSRDLLICAVIRLAVIGVGAGILFAGVARGGTEHPWLLPAVMVCVVTGDLVQANRHIHPVTPSGLMQGAPMNPAEKRLVNAAVIEPKPVIGNGRVRVASAGHLRLDKTLFTSAEAAVQIPRLALLLNTSLLERIPKLDGFLSLYLPHTLEVVRRLEEVSPENRGKILDFLGVTHESRERFPWIWDQRSTGGSWIHWVQSAEYPQSNAESLKRLFSPEFHPGKTVLIHEENPARKAASPRNEEKGAGSAKWRLRVQGHGVWEIDIESEGGGWLVVAQSFDRGWKAELDGNAVPLLRANHAFQAVEVGAGQHRLILRYDPGSFRLGIWISAVALGAWLVGMSLTFKRRSPAAPGNEHQTSTATG